MQLNFVKKDENSYDITTPHDAVVGILYQEIDGYFVFRPVADGFWDSHSMRVIAEKLDAINKPWDDIVNESGEQPA